ncbi:PREDICTED: uncharacterized protein LOC108965666 [Bactrocera latifrons]|uniref:THAP-type domain-containing protein n=1 Tax=Bactrocera latifrons TaxID=174628 RepID=A0A0K8WGT0_BACLA|nr:PREDICTED: uncharacterized protein LOC108965666 [Bactrocera latifrons]
MTLQICSYQGCYTQRFPCSSITFFQLPTDEPRRTHWILNSGNKQLLNLKNSQKRYFCEDHFQKKDIKPHFYRKLLYKNAVPMPYMSDDVSTTTTNTNTIQFTEFEVVRDYQNEVKGTDEDNLYQEFEIKEGEYEAETAAKMMSTNDNCFLYDECNEDDIQENKILTEELLDIPENISNPAEVTPSKQESMYIDSNDFVGTSVADDAASTSCISPSASSTTDVIYSTESQNAYTCTTNDCIATAAEINTDLVLKNDKEIYNDLNETTVPDKSYESDKHFALSLVYYFQRLNAKKKAQAKIDILTYLVALEQDKNS